MNYKAYAITLGLMVALGATGLAYPATAACIIATEGTHSSSQQTLLRNAKIRIQSKFGTPRSQPVVYFFDREKAHWPLQLNQFGSTSFLGYRTCVGIGPHGQNIDVVAHELMHAEIAYRAGFWGRLTQVPVWFDEGLAMQVDYRKRYDLRETVDTAFITKPGAASEFFVADTDALTRHYAAAKSEVSDWLSREPRKNVYAFLTQIRQGASFDSLWKQSAQITAGRR